MKDSHYIQHDYNSQADEKVLELRAKYGWEGFGLYWAINECLAEASDCKLSLKRLSGLAIRLSLQAGMDLEKFVQDCIEIGLYVSDGECYWSDRLLRDKMAWKAKIEKFSQAGKKGQSKAQATSEPGLNHPETTLEPPLNNKLTNLTKQTEPTKQNQPDQVGEQPGSAGSLEEEFFRKIAAAFGQSNLAPTAGRLSVLRMARHDRDVGAEMCVKAAQTLAGSDSLPQMKHYDWLFDSYKWKERLTLWGTGGPPAATANGRASPKKAMWKRGMDEWLEKHPEFKDFAYEQARQA